MTEFSVVIPVYNRIENIKLVLGALSSQQKAPIFDVIIADDGSTDGLKEYILSDSNATYEDLVRNSLDIKYLYCGTHNGFRPHRTRNIGIAQAKYPYVILLDSDVLLNPYALHWHDKIREEHKNEVIIGMYHFAVGKPSLNDAVNYFDRVMNLVPNVKSSGPPTPGLDCRIEGFTNEVITEYDGLGFFGGNQCWSTSVFWELGGYDENMPSGMGEDAEIGQRMRLAKLPVIQHKEVYGVHIPHDRSFVNAGRLLQQSILYIDKKYHIGTYSDFSDPSEDPRSKDLSMWYTKEKGAKLAKTTNESTVYAIDGSNKWYVGIPSPVWVELLGFVNEDIQEVEASVFEKLDYKGVIRK